MRVALATAMSLLASACQPQSLPDQVKLAVRLRDAVVDGRPVSWELGTLSARAIRLRPCPEDPVVLQWPGDLPDKVRTLPARATPQPWTVGFEGPLSLLDGARTSMPIGPWCALDVVLDGPLAVVGDVEGAGQIWLQLTLPSLGSTLTIPFAQVEIVTSHVSGGSRTRALVRPLVLELGAEDWLDALPEVPAVGASVAITDGDDGHDALRDALVDGAALYRDLDDDGQAGPREHDVGEVTRLFPLDDGS